MNRLDKTILYIIMGGAPPVLFMLIAWRLGAETLSSNYVMPTALAGFFVGLLIDILVLDEFVNRAFTLPILSLIALYSFYLFLFWIINYKLPWQSIIPGLGAGWFAGRKAYFIGGEKILAKQLAKKANTICFLGTLTTFIGTIIFNVENKDDVFQWPARLGIHLSSSFWLTIIIITSTALITLTLQWGMIRGIAILVFRYGKQQH